MLHSPQNTDLSKLPASSQGAQLKISSTKRRKATLYRKQTVFEQDGPPFLSIQEVLVRVGFFGRYQVFCCVITIYSAIFWTTNYLLLLHPTVSKTWSCSNQLTSVNQTYYLQSYGKNFCEEIINCTVLRPVNSTFVSVVDEWKLFCDDSSLSYFVLLSYVLGRMLGCFVGGFIGDNIGRMWGIMCLQAVLLVTSMMSIASTTWKTFIAFQFFNGIIYGHMRVTCTTMLVETADRKYRTITHMCFQKSLGFIVNAMLASCTLHWRMHIIMMNLLASPLLYFYLLYQESYRWLISTGRLKKALNVISELNSDRWRKIKQPEIYEAQLAMIPHSDPRKRPYTLLDLICFKRWRPLILLLAVLHIINGTTSTVFYPYDEWHYFNVNFHLLLCGLLSLISSIAFVVADIQIAKLGHKPILLVCLTIQGLALLGLIIYPLNSASVRNAVQYSLKLILIMVGESVYHLIIFHATTASFPTVVRCHAFALFHACYDVGIIFMTLLLVRAKDNAIYPFILCEVLVVLGGVLTFFFFPETKYARSNKLFPDMLPTAVDSDMEATPRSIES
ncbi:unnamed protein product [Soboliphyme baturini]|uniref:MFS domain-containing protein n=1 Tax=Soboliphyme baturini TaxID=241478 RepID=A0A183IBE4_9BILA|nr:unnamed protein product [Soboliphyme baturini]